MSVTVGIDLSTQRHCTGVCVLAWDKGRARITLLAHRGYDTNDQLVTLIEEARPAKVAIDAPFGWPVPFVDSVSTYTREGRWPAGERLTTVHRETDRHVRQTTGVRPLSVAAEKLAHPAIRCAELLTTLAAPKPVDRTGAGLCAEVYPAAALDRWGQLPALSYRSGTDAERTRETLMTGLGHRAPWLDIDEHATVLVRSDHLIDALVCAILARALTSRPSLTDPIPTAHRSHAEREGWIHLPLRDTLERLA